MKVCLVQEWKKGQSYRKYLLPSDQHSHAHKGFLFGHIAHNNILVVYESLSQSISHVEQQLHD